jgi:hypothetical protein
LARLGSIDGSYATIDLKDASDMISNDLVIEVFGKVAPTFLQLIQDCRSTRAKLPDGTILPLRKFASMGSALCFPIEAMVFFTIVMYTLVKISGKVPSRRLLTKLSRDVAVYGDDIIIPSSTATRVMEDLESYGLRVNHDKSFHTGLFRESCGGDYYNGVDITPTYVTHWDDTGTLSNSSQRVTYVALANTFYMKGQWHASQYLRDRYEELFGPLPLSQHPIGCLHWASLVRSSNLEYDQRLHSWRVRGLKPKARRSQDSPSTISGHLLLVFQPRHRSESLREYGRYSDVVERPLGCSGVRYSQLGQSPSSPGFTGPGAGIESYHDSGHYGVRAWVGQFRNGFVPGRPTHGLYQHLTTAVSTDVDTSVRPHVLSLKRGMAASPAGLTW